MLDKIRKMFGFHSQEGATAVEYGIMVAAIAAVIVAIVFLLGGQVEEAFTNTCTAMDDTADATVDCTP